MCSYNPDQYSEQSEGLEPHTNAHIAVSPSEPEGAHRNTKEHEAEGQCADWIDTYVISEVIAEELEEAGIPITLETCQNVWLAILEDLHYQVRCCIER